MEEIKGKRKRSWNRIEKGKVVKDRSIKIKKLEKDKILNQQVL